MESFYGTLLYAPWHDTRNLAYQGTYDYLEKLLGTTSFVVVACRMTSIEQLVTVRPVDKEIFCCVSNVLYSLPNHEDESRGEKRHTSQHRDTTYVRYYIQKAKTIPKL